MAPKPANVRKAFKMVLNLIENLNAGPPAGRAQPGGGAVVSIAATGMVQLVGKEAELFEATHDRLEQLDGGDHKLRRISREELHGRLMNVLRRTLRGRESITREAFKRRVGREMTSLRKAVLGPLKEWLVTHRVSGFRPNVLPFTFGRVVFNEGTRENAETIANRLHDVVPRQWSGRRRPHSAAKENEARVGSRAELVETFSKDALATIVVRASDAIAARRIALARLRQTIDIVNFFAAHFDVPRHRDGRAFVPPDGPRIAAPWAVQQVDAQGGRWSTDSHPSESRVVAFDTSSPRAKECGVARVHKLLAGEERSDLEQRLLMALSWAGRATTELRPDQAFVFHSIALEAILTSTRNRGRVTDRFRHGVTLVIGGSAEHRQEVYELVSRLYALRSEIVHSGDAVDFDEADLRTMHEVVDAVLAAMLVREPFTSMRDAAAFESWLHAQQLGGA